MHPRTLKHLFALGLALMLCCAAPSFAQVIEDDEEIEINTDLVHLDVSVTDANGKSVTHLRPEDFKLYEDGEPRSIAFFNLERRSGAERPVAVVFALDVSGSMTAAELERLRVATLDFTRELNRNQSVFAVMSFGMRVRILQNFTNDIGKINRAFVTSERYGRLINAHLRRG